MDSTAVGAPEGNCVGAEGRGELLPAEKSRKGPQRPRLPWTWTCRGGDECPGDGESLLGTAVLTLQSPRAADAISPPGAEVGTQVGERKGEPFAL